MPVPGDKRPAYSLLPNSFISKVIGGGEPCRIVPVNGCICTRTTHPAEPYYRLAMTAAGKHQVSRTETTRRAAGRQGRAGIRDVAAAAGVSITTVSDALNGKGRLPDATRRHVREVADRLGYRPSAATGPSVPASRASSA